MSEIEIKEGNKIHAIVAPKKKLVKIMLGKKVVKVYSFKMDVPFKIIEKERNGYDWGAWSISDRDFTYKVNEKVYDENVINEIKQNAINEYLITQTSIK